MESLTKLTTNINLEMSGDTKRYLVSAKQGDRATRVVKAKLWNDGVAYTIPSGARVVMNVKKPDGKFVYNTCTFSGAEVTIELTNQTLAAAGTAYCDVEVRTSDNSELITSASFTIEIEASQRSDGAIISCNELTELENRIAGHIKSLNDTENATKQAESARVKAESSRATAENTRVETENIRNQNETTRIQQENARQQNTAQTIQSLNDTENATKQAESARVKAESSRVTAENARVAAENVRNQNETTRIQQENARQQNTAQAIQNAAGATSAAVEATKDCKDITGRAEKALKNQEQLEATLNTATQIKQQVSQMQTAVEQAKAEVTRDKEEIEDTIQNSLLASAEQILESVQNYFNRAEALYQSMYFDCDGETPSLRAMSPIFIDGATPAVRNMDEGIDFDGGTPTSRMLAS